MPRTPGMPVSRQACVAATARTMVSIVADQRGQKTGGAEAPVGLADGAYGFRARVVVEQYAAAAVDLHVDESGQQQLSAEVDDLASEAARILRIDQGFDARARKQQSLSAHDALTGQQPAVGECRSHHIVSVTLRRCAGWSGSNPRRTESVAIKR